MNLPSRPAARSAGSSSSAAAELGAKPWKEPGGDVNQGSSHVVKFI